MELNLFANFCLNIKCRNFDLIHFCRNLLYMHTHTQYTETKFSKNKYKQQHEQQNPQRYSTQQWCVYVFELPFPLPHTHTEPFANIALAFPWNDTATQTHAPTLQY